MPTPATPLLPGSVEQYLTTRVAVCHPDQTAEEARGVLMNEDLDTVDDVAV